MKRDEWFTHSLGQTQDLIGQQRQRLETFIEGARSEEALGHAAMYEEVAKSLKNAWQAMGDAYGLMKDGDPEDYVS